MAPQNAKSLMKEFRASFRRKKVTDSTPKIDKKKLHEEEELAKLLELKENLGENLPPNYTDVAILGFLRARNLNVKEAEKLLKLDVNLREFFQVDRILENYVPSEVNRKYSCSGLIGFDKEGSLVRVMNAGSGDFKGYVHCVSTIEEFKIFVWFLESDNLLQKAENKKTGRNNHQFVYILNLEHLSLSQVMYKPSMDTAMIGLKLLQDHFHDAVRAIYIVNAPTFFASAFKLFKPVIQDSLQQKLRIYDGDGWKEELLKHIDADVLPAYLGGNRVDSNKDPMCLELIGSGGTIPEEFYANNFLDPDDPDVVSATVPAGSFLNFRFPTPVKGTVIRWHIQAKDNDIGICVFMEPLATGLETPKTQEKKKKEEDMSKLEQLTPVARSQCHICPEIGSMVTWFSGTTVLHFDNTYSWMMSKEVQFKLTLEPPVDNKSNFVSSTRLATKEMQNLSIIKN